MEYKGYEHYLIQYAHYLLTLNITLQSLESFPKEAEIGDLSIMR